MAKLPHCIYNSIVNAITVIYQFTDLYILP